ncbi:MULTISPECIES: rhamnogalacturonan lyase B N-terminal domain-containing protein [unclassified Pseudomonas]|uniref:rhamnogalacturonan lyase B N-terminal domain-containing protein n=1 Tax=unclassified Pseudomonas TaxID=196821 RepID=UPI00215C21D5|nr:MULTISPECIES: rhamnogalacturonan lyase B N-terminal domain-containing protein [unclassified Pseudomonas]MCR8932237.1 polysaccharide lyase family protein [Pseudomonas sp. S11A4]MCR8975844.1 polysaccharide lyase family protein [Pseudomonas sp. S11P7]
MRRFQLIMFCGLALAAQAHAATFGLTRIGTRTVVDSGADLVFSVDNRNGDLVSMRYRDNELQTTEPKASQLASGLGSAQVDARVVGDVIVISARAGDLTQYYLAKKGRNAIYMATYAPTLLPVGELRFVARLNVNKLPKADHGTDSNVGTAIEGKDVFLLPDGRTSSKFYSAQPMIRDPLHGVKGPSVAVYMLMGNRELSSGGPFFKDIATQKTPVTHELYNYMFSNHTQTEAYRGGLHGVYGLLFTDGGTPSPTLTDLGFATGVLGLDGFVDDAERGAVAGQVSGVVTGQPAVVGLSNASAEYWAPVDGNGRFQITAVRMGRYRMTLYQNELEVARSTVEVGAGSTRQTRLQAQPLNGRVKWQIGVADGTPSGFRNARLLSSAHPSDTRMAPWGPVVYNVDSSQPADFPAAQWRDINTPTRINFMLAADEVRDYRLRLFISLAQAGGRPQVRVNQHWEAPIPPPTNQPDSRGITRGTYRGNNSLFEVSVPVAALHPGANFLEIGVASAKAGDGFLSPGFVFDSVQWVVPLPSPE